MKLNYKDLILFSIPAILGSLLEPIAGIVDTAFVGRLDTNWLASMAIGVSILSTTVWIFNFLVHTSTASVAEAEGRNDFQEIGRIIKICFIISFVLGVFSALILILFHKPLFIFMGVGSDLYENTYNYFWVRLFGLPFSILFTAFMGIFRGLKKVKLVFMISLLVTILNIILTYTFLYKFKSGIIGAGLGTSISFFVGCFIFTLLLVRSEYWSKLHIMSKEPIPRGDWLRFGGDSLNLFGRSAFLSGSFFLSTAVASRLGNVSLAAHQIALNIWLFFSFFIDGLAITGNIYTANFIGQKNISQLPLLFSRLLKMGGILGVLIGSFYFILDDLIFMQFTNDELVKSALREIWPWICIIQFINALAFIYDGILFGSRDFSFLKRHMFFGVVLCILPGFAYSYFNGGLLGIWLGFSALNIYRSVSGWWKSKLIAQPS